MLGSWCSGGLSERSMIIFSRTLSGTKRSRFLDKQDLSWGQLEIVRPLSVKLQSITEFAIMPHSSIGCVGGLSLGQLSHEGHRKSVDSEKAKRGA